jgi:PAS domain S-box-containing protein
LTGRSTWFALANVLIWPALATALDYALHLQNKPGASVVYVLAVALSTYFGGVVAGIASAVLSFLALTYFFVAPVHSFQLHAENVTGLVLFALAALGVGYLLVRERRAKQRADELLRQSSRLFARLAAGEERLASVIQSSLDGIVVIDEDGVVELFNPASERLFGYTADEVVGRNVSMLMPEPYRGEHDGYLSRYLETGVPHVIGVGREVEGLRKDGTTFPFELSLAEVRLDERRLFTSAIHDLTERRRRDAEREVVVERLDRLHRVAAALSRAVTVPDALNVILGEGIAASGARAGLVGLVNEAGDTIEVAATRGYPERTIDAWRSFPVARRLPLSDVVRTGQAFFCESEADSDARWPAFSGVGSSHAFVALPLAARGTVLGAIGLTFDDDRSFSEDERELLLTVARQCAQALERARLYEREHEIAVAVQRSLLPRDVAVSEEVSVVARYLPASPGLEIGGDWYDVMRLGPKELVISIGDVVGHGLHAAATMGQLRNAARAYALEGSSPSEIVGRLITFVGRFPEGEFSTLFVGRLDLDGRVLEYTNAGHPPPLLRRPNGETVWLDDARAFPVGVEVGSPCPSTTVDLEPGTLLFLYTDGLVERRTRSLEEGLAALETVIETGADDPEQLVEQVIAAIVDDGVEHSDDIAMVTFRFLPDPDFRVSFDANPELAGELRNRLHEWLESAGATPDEIFDVTLACTEAFANAIEHPVDAAQSSVDIEGTLANGDVTVVIRDHGGWREHRLREEGGLGLPLMRSLMSSVDVKRRADGTTVVLRRRLSSAIAA